MLVPLPIPDPAMTPSDEGVRWAVHAQLLMTETPDDATAQRVLALLFDAARECAAS